MKNVMIVDDNCLTAEGIEKNIDWSALDATVIAVEYNSLSALDILKDTHVDLIISDIEMPDLDGISMSQKALEIQPFIKVILVSAYDKFEYAKRAIRLCVYDYIEKPLDYHYLTEKIKNAFTDIDRTQKNTELVKASRPVMTEKFFHDLLHYPGVDPATHLSQYLKYLDLRSDYDFFDVLILETEPDPAKSELDFTQYQIQLLNILNLVKEEMEIFDNVFYLKEFSGIVCIIGQNSKHPQHFLQVIPSSLHYCRVLQKQCVFQSFCKRVLHNEACNAHDEIRRRRKREVSFCDLALHEERQLYTTDKYFQAETAEPTYQMAGKEITPKLLLEAIRTLPEEKRTAILLYYFEGMTDVEIGKMFNTSRSTIQYRRTSSFELLKKYLEEHADEWNEW